MQEKQKVTLYLPDDLHHQLKIRAAVDREPMSALAQKALDFYLTHSEVVESFREYGQTHRVYACPSCSAPLTMGADGLSPVNSHGSSQAIGDVNGDTSKQEMSKQEISKSLAGCSTDDLVPDVVPASVASDDISPDKGELVPC